MNDEIKNWMRHKNEEHEGTDWFGIAIIVTVLGLLALLGYALTH